MTPDKQIKVDIIANAIQVIIPRFGLIVLRKMLQKNAEREKKVKRLAMKKNMI